MTIEQLIIPRFKVIADYPGNAIPVGVIFSVNDFSIMASWPIKPDKYPHLFKKIDWWEGVAGEDMPKYLKFIWHDNIDEVEVVHSWLKTNEWDKTEPNPINGFSHESHSEKGLFPRVSLNGWLPATEEEFNAFVNSNTDK